MGLSNLGKLSRIDVLDLFIIFIECFIRLGRLTGYIFYRSRQHLNIIPKPANFAYHAQVLGAQAAILTRSAVPPTNWQHSSAHRRASCHRFHRQFSQIYLDKIGVDCDGSTPTKESEPGHPLRGVIEIRRLYQP